MAKRTRLDESSSKAISLKSSKSVLRGLEERLAYDAKAKGTKAEALATVTKASVNNLLEDFKALHKELRRLGVKGVYAEDQSGGVIGAGAAKKFLETGEGIPAFIKGGKK